MQYSDYKGLASSEKITLATMEVSKRLMGWTLHSGYAYRIEGVTFPVIVSLEDSGTPFEQVYDYDDLNVGKYFLDRDAQILYACSPTLAGEHLNSRFLVAKYKLFFSNVPIALPHDLDDGKEVFWEPLIRSTSQFGVEIDTINQTSQAIEGSGSLTLINDQDFWPANFDKLYFENGLCEIYSYHRDLPVTEAKMIYSGRVEKKSYATDIIQFQLKDLISEIRSPIDLGVIEDLGGRTGSDLAKARQRLVVGRVYGHRPVNIDQVLDGYPLTGTVSATSGSATLTGSGTLFISQLSPDDRVVLDDVEYTIASITSNTSAELSEEYAEASDLSGATAYLLPDQPKRWMNRVWHIAGHALREPTTTVSDGSSVNQIILEDASDIFPEDWIYVGTLGSGELVKVDNVVGSRIVRLQTSLNSIPFPGTAVRRPAVQNVRINNRSLVYYQDYTLNADTAILTLRDTADSSASEVRSLTNNLVFNLTRTVTGTDLKATIKSGYMVGVEGNADFFEVMSVDSDTQLTLRTAATINENSPGRYKPLVFDPNRDVLSLDVLGKTDDGTKSGALLKTSPAIVRALLVDLGLEDRIDDDSFDAAEETTYQAIGAVFPEKFNESKAPTYRDVFNDLNASALGSLIQNGSFQLAYQVLQPRKETTATRFDESDILSIKFDSTSEKIVKTAIVEYRRQEYDYLTGEESVRSQQKTSDIANHVVKSTREQTFRTSLVDESAAEILANRWAFILENGAGRVVFTTKLQGMEVSIGDVIEVSHRKLFERFGTTTPNRLFFVEAVKKSGSEVTIEAVDLSNAFTRVACFNDSSNEFSDATDEEKLYGGYFTDEYGLIDNDPDSFGTNLFW